MVSPLAFKGSPSGQIIRAEVQRPPLENAQVLVKIHKAGFCGTDLHYTYQDMVLGHEGAGKGNGKGGGRGEERRSGGRIGGEEFVVYDIQISNLYTTFRISKPVIIS